VVVRTSESATVSVVIPTYNRCDLVVRALASVAGQSRPVDQVIVVDDGSTDGTAEKIEAEFQGIEVHTQENRGVSSARNRGIRAARGEWIAFLDSDDEWHPAKLERQLDVLATSRYRVCHCEEIWIRGGRRVNPGQRHAKPDGWIYRSCLPLCAISPSAVIIHRTVFETIGLFDESLPVCEDYDLWLRISARYPVELVDEALVTKYGGHTDQLSTSMWGMDRFRVRSLERAWRRLPLTAGDRIATLEILLAKLEILVGGARKRQRDDLLGALEPKLPHFARLLELERAAL
jgi:GT2 family glycosyltransferase